jgi:hypothetical protein
MFIVMMVSIVLSVAIAMTWLHMMSMSLHGLMVFCVWSCCDVCAY